MLNLIFPLGGGISLKRESISLGHRLGKKEDRKNILPHLGVGVRSGSHSYYRKRSSLNKSFDILQSMFSKFL